MRILVAPDKFKGSMSAREAADAIAAGVRAVLQHAQITSLPMADGGEGTAQVICSAKGGRRHECNVQDALGNTVRARYCTIEDNETAVMEMSEAAGLWRVPEALRNPDLASSFGVGQMLLRAARGNAKNILIGLGGSATNDAGVGLARALALRFLDERGAELSGAVTQLARLARIEPPREMRLPRITAAADVENPLLGSSGATRVFGPQKGATREAIELLEAALRRLVAVVTKQFGSRFEDVPGAGAAGGLGYGLMTFCGASIRSGFDVVAEQVGLEAAVRACDVVITGEGRLDAQTLHGKAPAGVARLARKYGKASYAIVGELDRRADTAQLFDGIHVARPAGMSRAAAIENAKSLLQASARELARRLV